MLYRLQAAMAGRNGIDHLAVIYILLAFIANFLTRIFGLFPLGLISTALMILAIWRMFSKKVEKRKAENVRFVHIWSDMKSGLKDWRVRRNQSKDYKFFTCPECKCRLRVARGKGKIQITCSRCGLRFGGKT